MGHQYDKCDMDFILHLYLDPYINTKERMRMRMTEWRDEKGQNNFERG